MANEFNANREGDAELGESLELSELMMAHLDEVEGGGAHSSWRRVTAQLAAD